MLGGVIVALNSTGAIVLAVSAIVVALVAAMQAVSVALRILRGQNTGFGLRSRGRR